jgi:hypothetical protein
MRVIRPASLADDARRHRLQLGALIFLGVLGVASGLLAGAGSPASAITLGMSATVAATMALSLLVGAARMNPDRRAARELESLLAGAFDDSYTLVLMPRLPIRGRGLSGLLVGPPGVRVLTVRRWEGQYRVRGRTWEFAAGGRHGWVPCRTNPGFEARGLADGVSRWAAEMGLGQVPVVPAVAFPKRSSHVVLEEPVEEVITTDNVPWWANSIGHVQRYDPASCARFVRVVLEATERLAAGSFAAQRGTASHSTDTA